MIVRLPRNTVFNTPHGDEWHRQIAQDGLILLSEVGSGLHGIAVGGDDRDLQGVCVEPPEVMLGLRDFRLYEHRTQPVGVRSGARDVDLSVYGLATYTKLIIAGNPTHLLPLFAPENKLECVDDLGRDMREHAGMFLARTHGQRFLGYLRRQRERMTGNLSQRTNRPELIEKYGVDTKFASHALRIAMQGIELMQSHTITLPMPDNARGYLIGVRTGTHTKEQILSELASLEADLVRAIRASSLPEHIDKDKVSGWMTDVYMNRWAATPL